MRKVISFAKLYPSESLLTVVFFPFLLYAVQQDTMKDLPWYLSIPVGILGWAAGLLLCRKVMDPIFKYVDEKTKKLVFRQK